MYTKAIVRKPCSKFEHGITEADMGLPDYGLALTQHELYCQALESCGLEILQVPPDPDFPDCCFVEDTAVIANGAAIITRLGHVSRRGEEKSIATVLNQSKQLLHIEEPGTVDGGDIMRLGNHFFIGISQRTNEEGAKQLASFLAALGKTASMVRVDRFIHLKTFVSSIDDDSLLCLEGQDLPELHKFASKVIAVPLEEHWAANCVSVNGTVLVPEGSPRTCGILKSAGMRVISLDMSEFQKMDGRLTCLSILL